jgi:hypothetical protein
VLEESPPQSDPVVTSVAVVVVESAPVIMLPESVIVVVCESVTEDVYVPLASLPVS